MLETTTTPEIMRIIEAYIDRLAMADEICDDMPPDIRKQAI